MRPSSIYSTTLEIAADPYRNKRSYKDKETKDATTYTKHIFQPEPGRTHSYLPYSNHPLDLSQSRSNKDLYLEESHAHDTTSSASSQFTPDEHPAPTSPHQSIADQFHKRLVQNRTPSSRRCRLYAIISTSLIVLGLVIFFCWPRTFRIRFNKTGEKLERVGEPADWGPAHQPWLRASWKLNLTVDNTVNWVPTHVKDLELVLMDRDTQRAFAWSRSGAFVLKGQEEALVRPVFRVDYESPSMEDETFRHLYDACGPQTLSDSPALNVTLQAVVHISGILWSSIITVHPTEGLYCPFN